MARLQEFETPKRRGRPPLARIEDAPPKRRGRPPKLLAEALEPPKRRGRPPLIRTAIEEPPKRRGRPPLVRTGLRAEEPPKRRGRPPRASAAMEAEAPKRRGRPPRLSVREVAEIAAAGDQPKRRGRPARARPEADEGVKKAFPLIGRNDLNRLLEEAAIFHNRASSATGALGELIKDYVQKKHLHAGAFKIVNRWKKLGDDDPQKLWLELAHVDDMRAKAGIDRIAKAQGQLLPAIADEVNVAEKQHEKEEPEDEDRSENPEPVNYPPREVAEHAGEAA